MLSLLTKKEPLSGKNIEAPLSNCKDRPQQEITPEEPVIKNGVTQDRDPEQNGVVPVATQKNRT